MRQRRSSVWQSASSRFRENDVWVTLLAEVVAASTEVAATSSRSRKVAILAELLSRLEPAEIPISVGFLSGVPRQGRVGVGYSTIYGIERAAAPEPSLTVRDLDRVITEIKSASGSGSASRRRQLLDELFGRASEAEGNFVRRLFTGELRQGALAGLMADAVAKAAGVPPDTTRRALMLSGDLTRTAEVALADGMAEIAVIDRGSGIEPSRRIRPQMPHMGASLRSLRPSTMGPSKRPQLSRRLQCAAFAPDDSLQHPPDGRHDYAKIKTHRAIGDVFHIVSELVRPRLLARHSRLRKARDARAHDQSLPVLRN